MPYEPIFTDEFLNELKWRKKKDKTTYLRIMKKIAEILENPEIGKPLGNVLVDKRRVHIGHFVISYKVQGSTVIMDAFEHHDNAY